MRRGDSNESDVQQARSSPILDGVPLFRKARSDASREDPIAAFWSWWSTTRRSVEDAIDAKELPQSLIDDISRHVIAIDPGLAWEIGPGRRARYQLCVSAEGDMGRRAITEWWRGSAPADSDWDYYASRQPTPDASGLQIGSHTLQAQDLRFETSDDVNRERIDLKVWHPLFSQLDDNVRAQVTYLWLDALFGEDGVERWFGRIERVSESPPDAIDRDALELKVRELASTATGDRFVLGQTTASDGQVRILLVNTALKHIDHLDKSFRVRLTIKLKTPGASGLPAQDESDALNALEDRFGEAHKGAVFAGRVTGSGIRTLNWYVADPSKAEAAISEVIRASGWKFDTRTDPDPQWEGLKRNLLD